MWKFLLVLAAACHSDPAPTSRVSASYCRASGKFTEAPLGTMTGSGLQPAHTFSIVARDPVTGELGVAVQSHYFNVGAMVMWAEAGVGAIATQSQVEPGYGPRGLALMRDGTTAPDAMAQLIAADKRANVRQLGFIDAQGHAASHTGAKCYAFAGSHVGANYTIQANTMGNDKVIAGMSAAFETAKGDLANRMMTALDAAQAIGGDLRGCQSAAMLVVSGKRSDTPWSERKLDLRVEDSPAPLDELRRLITVSRAYAAMEEGGKALEAKEVPRALVQFARAAELVPDNAELVFWPAVVLAGAGHIDEAMPMFKKVFAADPAWVEMVRRLPAAGDLEQVVADQIVRSAR